MGGDRGAFVEKGCNSSSALTLPSNKQQQQYFTVMHLAEAFIQRDLQCIQVIHFYQYVCSLGIEPTTFCAAIAMLYHWATGTPIGARNNQKSMQHAVAQQHNYWEKLGTLIMWLHALGRFEKQLMQSTRENNIILACTHPPVALPRNETTGASPQHGPALRLVTGNIWCY